MNVTYAVKVRHLIGHRDGRPQGLLSIMMFVHRVPYFSQFASPELVGEFLAVTPRPLTDDPRWAESGAATVSEYAWWARRVCGMACLRMVLGARGDSAPPLVPLAKECLRHGDYVRREDGSLEGLIYVPFVRWIGTRFNIKADVRARLELNDVADAVADGCLVMISVHPSLRWPQRRPPRRGGHLVLAVGVSSGMLLIHNPSGLPGRSQEYTPVTFSQLENFFAGRGVVLRA